MHEKRKVTSSYQQYGKTGQMVAGTNSQIVCAVFDKAAICVPTT